MTLPGHSRGHAAIAVDANDGWLLQAGDAFYDHRMLAGNKQPFLLRTMENLVAWDLKQVRRNHERLAELHRRPDAAVTILNAHDPVLLRRACEAIP